MKTYETQTFSQKYTIIQLFKNATKGSQFSSNNWPLHATLVDTFAIERDVSAMIEKLTELLSSHAPAVSVVEGNRFFGDNGQVQVALPRKTDSLVQLHNDVIQLLEQGGWKPNDSQFARDGFSPHSTIQKHARLNKDDPVVFDALTVIDMFPNDDPHQRKVLKTIKISKQ